MSYSKLFTLIGGFHTQLSCMFEDWRCSHQTPRVRSERAASGRWPRPSRQFPRLTGSWKLSVNTTTLWKRGVFGCVSREESDVFRSKLVKSEKESYCVMQYSSHLALGTGRLPAILLCSVPIVVAGVLVPAFFKWTVFIYSQWSYCALNTESPHVLVGLGGA